MSHGSNGSQTVVIPPPVPSVDDLINKCEPLSGDARATCWVQWDEHVTNDIVPWIPWRFGVAVAIVGDSVTHWEYDQFSGYISFAHISVDNKVDPNTLSV